MKVTFDGSNLEVNFHELVGELDLEGKRELAKSLIWDKELFDEFIEALAGDRIVSQSYSYYVYEARLRLVEMLPEMNRNIVRSLLRELETAKEDSRRHSAWAYKLYHSRHESELPKLPEYIHIGFKSDAEVDAYIASRGQGDEEVPS